MTLINALNKPDSTGMPPLHIAAAAGDLKTVSELLALGADPTTVNHHLQLPIFSALFLPIVYEEDLKENKIKIFKMLMEKAPASIIEQDDNGNTLLHLIASNGLSTLIPEVLKTNATLCKIQNYHSHYPVHTAILNHQIDCARILLQDNGAELLSDSQGRVPLHYAALYSGKDMVELCCNLSTNLNPLDDENKTPLILATEVENTEAMEILKAHGAQQR